MADYEIYLSDPFGNRLGLIPTDSITLLSYALVVNGVGSLTLEMPREAFDDAWFAADARLEIRRRPYGGPWTLEGGTFWLVQKMTRGLTQNGRYRRLTALSANTLLSRRFTMYYAGDNPVRAVADEADDVLKGLATSNFGTDVSPIVTAGVTPSRIAATIVVDANASDGPLIDKDFAWRNLLSVMQDLAADAASTGTPVYFGLVWTGAVLAFRTWVGQPGTDRTASGAGQLVISPERGSLGGTVEVAEDWTDAATWVVTGGQGQESARVLGMAYDAAQIAKSPFGVRELFVNATSMSTTASLDGEAAAELHRRRPKRTLTGSLVSIPGATYGIDWFHGDRIVAQFEQESFSALVETVTVKLAGGNEAIDAKITGEPA